MVRVKDQNHIQDDGTINLPEWLDHLSQKEIYTDNSLIRNACILNQLASADQATESGQSCLQQGLAIAEILADLDLDPPTLAAAIISESYTYADLSLEDIEEQLGEEVAKLVAGVERMAAIDILHQTDRQLNRGQIDNIRKMLIAMVDDVRIVLIKLAERLRILRTIAHLPDQTKRHIAQEVMEIYAPLANRLGVGHIKWEMEDLAFRYLDPAKYKEIAAGLKSKRVDRDKYVNTIVEQLNQKLQALESKNTEVYGRSKHIHSIYKKMQRKNINVDQIFDATAVRVLVDTTDDCYNVLSIIHNSWLPIPEEFDDYINNPKPNGYRSLHTAMVGPEDRVFEVQIRTHQMHSEAELGVAAHWRYKEGGVETQQSHERKIEWLREVLSWQSELSGATDPQNPEQNQFIEDRIYVFTPGGDILDLPKGATPLDFAYTIHTSVGHRCRGAKIAGSIVPLTHELETGDQVEILTTKQPRPSRDWLNPHAGYLKSSRAKAKVLHWFKQQDYEQNLEDGKDMIERDLKRLNLQSANLDTIAQQLNFKNANDMSAAVGRGDLRTGVILNRLQPETRKKFTKEIPTLERRSEKTASDINIQGVGNLLTYLAKCCNPLPGDPVIGYITRERGISIHRDDCPNILYANDHNFERLIKVTWEAQAISAYPAKIVITAYERNQLIHDLTVLLSTEKAQIKALNTDTLENDQIRKIHLSVDIESMAALSRLLDKIKQIPNVIEATRVSR